MLLKSVHESCDFQEQDVQASLPAQKSDDQAALSGLRSERQIFSRLSKSLSQTHKSKKSHKSSQVCEDEKKIRSIVESLAASRIPTPDVDEEEKTIEEKEEVS